ncbi:Mu transposase C-terminal domain-containing protein, partial [Christensenellaceae bacterium OttesenSCG-928-M15]|nr:Mu transposase C-terminal domain-containing protein [Christensenellaceae bacterium OttesenSCG-928-M15]
EGDLDGLTDRRGKWRKGKTDMSKELWDAFLWFYLDQRQHPVSKCVEYTLMWAQEYHPELVPNMPSYHAFRRQVQNDIPETVRVLMREGEKAYSDRCAPYIDRLYDDLQSNDYWVADNHTFDIITQTADGETRHRLYLTAFIDARSGIFTGWFVTDAPCSDATLMALRKGILRCGIPRSILVDNGREFLNYDVGGLGHRQKKSTKDLPTPPPIFERLGIEMRNAIVRNAKAKPIERTFGDLKNLLSRLFNTYTGGNPLEKPERLKKELKDGRIPLDDDLRAAVDDILDGYYNQGQYGGKVAKDQEKTRLEVFNENLHTKRVATAEDLTLLLMRSTRHQTVGRRGVHITVSGIKLWYWDTSLLIGHQGQKVYVRYDPEHLAEVRIYDEQDRFICTAPLDEECRIMWGDSKEKVQNAQRKKAKTDKAVKVLAEDYKSRLSPEQRIDALDLMIRKSQAGKEGMTFGEGATLEPVRAKEKQLMTAAPTGGAVIDMDRINRNAERRLKGL